MLLETTCPIEKELHRRVGQEGLSHNVFDSTVRHGIDELTLIGEVGGK